VIGIVAGYRRDLTAGPDCIDFKCGKGAQGFESDGLWNTRCGQRRQFRDRFRSACIACCADQDGAITAARTMLESVYKHICDERGMTYESGWDLNRLYKAAASAMSIAPDQHSEQVIKQILSGVTSVVGDLADLRNSMSDAHGRGKRSVGPVR
jgi:hypothetical protein